MVRDRDRLLLKLIKIINDTITEGAIYLSINIIDR